MSFKKFSIIFNIKALSIILLLSLFFLWIENYYSNTIVTGLNITITLYLCSAITYRLYQYFNKNHIIFSSITLFLVSGILFIAISILLNQTLDILHLTDFQENIILYYALIIIIPSILVLFTLTARSIVFVMKKRVSTVKLILAVVLFSTSLFIFYPPVSIKNDAISFYYQKVNPQAGIIYYERQYKQKLEEADRYRDQSNTAMGEIEKNEYAKESSEYFLSLMKDKRSRSREIFHNREQTLQQIIEISSLGQNMRLPDNQKLFYEKRKKADENELLAFQTYKLTQEKSLKGSIVYFGFQNLYDKALNSSFFYNPEGSDIQFLVQVESEIKEFYNQEVKISKDQNILSKDLFKDIDHRYEIVTKLFDYQKLMLSDPSSQNLKQKEEALKNVILSYGEEQQSSDDLYRSWMDSFISPGIYLQDKQHQQSFPIYKEAYDYAQKQNMDALFTVWDNDYPGYETPEEELTLNNSKDSVENYYKTYENPMVKYIRTALDSYLQGDPQDTIPQPTKEADEDEYHIYGLDSFDKEYYKSKFVVIYVEDFPYGGVQYTIMFQDNPDTFFTAWVYQYPDNTYELRGFSSKKGQNQEDIKRINTEFKEYLLDKEHSL